MNNDLRGLNLRKKKKNIDAPEEFFQDSIYNAQTKWGELAKYKDLAHFIGPEASLSNVDLNQISLSGTDFTRSIFEAVSLERAQLQNCRLVQAVLTKSSCKGANFEGADLTRADFRQVNLQGANLKNTDLRGTRLHSTEMDTNTSFAGALYDEHTSWPRKVNPQNLGAFSINALQGASLVGWVCRARDLEGVDLQGANLQGADLSKSNLRGVNLQGADLTNTNLDRVFYDDNTKWPEGFDYINSGAIGPNANLQGADLSEVDLEYADLQEANLSAANLEGVFFTESYLQGANLTGANLSGASLCDTDLRGVNLQGADLSNSDLRGVNLQGTDLIEVNLECVNLGSADLQGVNLTGANLSGASLCDTDLRGVDLQGADLTKADLSSANLIGANLTGANVCGANLEYVKFEGMFEASLIPWLEVQFDDDTVFPEAWIKDRLGTVKEFFPDIERRLGTNDQSSSSVSEDLLYVVHENEMTVDSRYRTDRESTIVGVTNCKEEALRMMNRTFFERLSRTDTTSSVEDIVEILIKKYGGRLLLFEEIYKVIQADVTWMDCELHDSHTLWYGLGASHTTSWTVLLSEVVPILK